MIVEVGALLVTLSRRAATATRPDSSVTESVWEKEGDMVVAKYPPTKDIGGFLSWSVYAGYPELEIPPQGRRHRTSHSRSCSPNPNRSLGLHFAPRHCESLQRHYIYTYDGACKVLGLEATILAMRPHTPTSSHESCLFGRWARAPNPVASRLETWQSSWHPYSRRAPKISHPFEPKCSRSDRSSPRY